MHVCVPFAATDPKTRLADCLDADERAEFARVMLDDVRAAVRDAGFEPTVLATADVDVDVPVVVDDRPLTDAVNAVLDARARPVAVVMADLALATPAALSRLFDAEGDVVAAPGRGGGTNALVVRDPAFRVDYHGVSFRDHREAAAAVAADWATVDSHRLATDVDERADLVEVLLHGRGDAPRWLRDAGFGLVADGGRVAARRIG
jgi:2-phospho-L-lactate guanylyltransferase